jgi:hypothetical protein
MSSMPATEGRAFGTVIVPPLEKGGEASYRYWRVINSSFSRVLCFERMKSSSKCVDTSFVIHYPSVMKNVTITLDEHVARWARIRAAELNTSVSRLVGEMLREKMLDDEKYEQASREYLSQKPAKLREPGAPHPKREDLYGR